MTPLEYLKNYQGRPLKIMEVCGTHTAQISRNGIPGLLPENIRLVSGPGCPVCVTVSSYIDRLIELGMQPGNVVVTFGDMLRVPGSRQSLSEAKAQGCRVKMVYSPLDTLKLARENPENTYIFAAVGFETTTPLYALLVQHCIEEKIENVKLLTSLKVMPPVIDWICRDRNETRCETNETRREMKADLTKIDGFLAPGHVSVITGSSIFTELAEKYQIPFVVSGFEGEEILASLAALVKLRGQGKVINFYPGAVTEEGNKTAQEMVGRYFETCDAAWRGMGIIPNSGKRLRREYSVYDAGGAELTEDTVWNKACRCADVLTGKIRPEECPLFGKVCTPQTPQGACMVSMEGSCFNRLTAR